MGRLGVTTWEDLKSDRRCALTPYASRGASHLLLTACLIACWTHAPLSVLQRDEKEERVRRKETPFTVFTAIRPIESQALRLKQQNDSHKRSAGLHGCQNSGNRVSMYRPDPRPGYDGMFQTIA